MYSYSCTIKKKNCAEETNATSTSGTQATAEHRAAARAASNSGVREDVDHWYPQWVIYVWPATRRYAAYLSGHWIVAHVSTLLTVACGVILVCSNLSSTSITCGSSTSSSSFRRTGTRLDCLTERRS